MIKLPAKVVSSAERAQRIHKKRVILGVPEELGYSHYFKNRSGQITHKTCPRCSRHAGLLVWYRLEDFGERTMEDGMVRLQSWCRSCRSKNRRK